MPARRQIVMPSFILKLVDHPKSPADAAAKLAPLYDKKSTPAIKREYDHVTRDKPFHGVLTYNTRENYRRSKTLSRFKHAICMQEVDYRRIFKRDGRFFMFYLTPHAFFANDCCKRRSDNLRQS